MSRRDSAATKDRVQPISRGEATVPSAIAVPFSSDEVKETLVDPDQLFQPRDAHFLDDPYSAYRVLRDQLPVFRGPDNDWIVTRYGDVQFVLTDPRFVTRLEPGSAPSDLSPTHEPSHHSPPQVLWAAGQDDHILLRARLTDLLTQRMKEVRASLPGLAHRLIVPLRGQGPIDIISSLAAPFTGSVICSLLGIPVADLDELQRLSSSAAEISDVCVPAVNRRRSLMAGLRLFRYFRELLCDRGYDSREKTSAAVEQQGSDTRNGTADDELVINFVMLFIAGRETTVNLIGNGLRALMRQELYPQLLVANRQGSSALASAIEELVRFDSPTQAALRIASQTVSVGGVRISRGDRVRAIIGSANRDPDVFSEPDDLDLTRSPNRHLAFSCGAHHCLGAAIARAEAHAVFGELARTITRLKLIEEPRYRQHYVFRGLERLLVESA
jgi:pimeloyl-[acyl-carrier protein] synthase